MDNKDEFAALLTRCKVEQESFVRSVQAAPEPACILGTSHQFDQLSINCTGEEFTVATVDPTFNLGHFYVTPLVFQLKQFVKKHTEEHPIFLGPLLIHNRLNYASYSYFAHQIVSLKPQLRNIRAIGTDGEEALYTAMKNVFHEAVHLRCFRHVRENILAKLRELNLTQSAQDEIISDIFGKKISATEQQLGLVDSTETEFEEKLSTLKDRWDLLELRNRRMLANEGGEPKFYRWFLQYKAQDMKLCMLKNTRQSAGLCSKGETLHFYTNQSESINRMLKDQVHHSKCQLNEFIDHMLAFVENQESHMKKSVCRMGDWRLLPDYQDMEKVKKNGFR